MFDLFFFVLLRMLSRCVLFGCLGLSQGQPGGSERGFDAGGGQGGQGKGGQGLERNQVRQAARRKPTTTNQPTQT